MGKIDLMKIILFATLLKVLLLGPVLSEHGLTELQIEKDFQKNNTTFFQQNPINENAIAVKVLYKEKWFVISALFMAFGVFYGMYTLFGGNIVRYQPND